MADNAMRILDVIHHHHITNAQELTAFFSGNASKGILTPYPKGFGVQLWKGYMKELRESYGDIIKKECKIKVVKSKNKRKARKNKHI